MPTPVSVRPRRDEDVAAVVSLLLRQQPLTRYPYRDPLPVPPEQFVQRPGELGAWVAEHDGRLAGHVSVLEVGETDLGRRWSEAAGRPVAALGAVSVLVVDHDLTGRGIGRSLLDVAEAFLVDAGRTPVLEVLGAHARAGDLYRARGWEEVGSLRPTWLPDGADELTTLMLLR